MFSSTHFKSTILRMLFVFPLIPALLLAIPGQMIAAEPKPGTQTAQELKVKAGTKETTVSYWLFLPKSYDKKKSWPLMLVPARSRRTRR